MKTLLQIGLYLVIIVLGYFIYESVMEPIRFGRDTAQRESAIIQKLKDIRSIQVAHRSRYGKFLGDLDSLVYFVKFDSLPIVTAVGSVPDNLTEAEAVRLGIIQRDTTWIIAKDSLFKSTAYPIDSLPYIPFSNAKRFTLASGTIERGLVTIPVFEAKTEAKEYMQGLKYKVYYTRENLKVGSMEESSIDGNWE
jgi:hypothetical protein